MFPFIFKYPETKKYELDTELKHSYDNCNYCCKFIDLIDWILEHVINENRTRRTIIKKLKEMCLIVNSKVSLTFFYNIILYALKGKTNDLESFLIVIYLF